MEIVPFDPSAGDTLEIDPALGDRLVKFPEVSRATGLSRNSLNKLMSKRQFPLCLELLSMRCWRASEINAWLKALPHVPPPSPPRSQHYAKRGRPKRRGPKLVA